MNSECGRKISRSKWGAAARLWPTHCGLCICTAGAHLVRLEIGFSRTRQGVAGVESAGRRIARCGNRSAVNATVRSTERPVVRLLGVGRGRRKSRRARWRLERYGNGSRGFAKSPATVSATHVTVTMEKSEGESRSRTTELTISSGSLLLWGCQPAD